MRNLINNLLGRLGQFNDWGMIRQYLIISLAPILLIGAVYTWQSGLFNSGANSQVLSVSEGDVGQTLAQNPTPAPSPQDQSIFIDISGAVNQPGIKELEEHARVNDAIWSAAGYTEQADKQYLAQVLNLAQPLNDGDKIYIPTYYEVSQSLPKPPTLLNKINEPINVLSGTKAGEPDKSNDQGGSADNTANKVNINTASQAQLEELPGIGEVNAKNIIDGRPYTSTSELCILKVVTNSSTCEKIQDLITI